MPTTEIVSFELAENADIAHALTIPARQPGCIGHSGGRREDDPRIFVWFIHWESLADHERFMQNPVEYGALHAALEGRMLGDPTILHVEFDDLATLRAPILDVRIVDGNRAPTSAPGTQSARGQLVEDQTKVVVVSGLQSEHDDAQPSEDSANAYRVVTTVRCWPDEPNAAPCSTTTVNTLVLK